MVEDFLPGLPSLHRDALQERQIGAAASAGVGPRLPRAADRANKLGLAEGFAMVHRAVHVSCR
jgi:hypothetical protein